MATVTLTVEVPDDEIPEFRRALVDLCFEHGLPVDDEDEFEEDTMPGCSIDTDPEWAGVEDLPPAHSPEEEAELHRFLETVCIVIVHD